MVEGSELVMDQGVSREVLAKCLRSDEACWRG